MIRRPPRSTLDRSSAASDVYKRQLVLGDYLIEGGENSWFHGIKLNRGYGADGKATVNPALVFRVPGWDQQLISDLGSKDPNRVSPVSYTHLTLPTSDLV